jgi:hypothetical protein
LHNWGSWRGSCSAFGYRFRPWPDRAGARSRDRGASALLPP